MKYVFLFLPLRKKKKKKTIELFVYIVVSVEINRSDLCIISDTFAISQEFGLWSVFSGDLEGEVSIFLILQPTL